MSKSPASLGKVAEGNFSPPLLLLFPTLDASSFVHHFEGDLNLVFPFIAVMSPVNSETQKESTLIMIRFRTSAIACLLAAALLATPAVAQDFVVGPLGYSTYRPVVTYSPVVTTPGRITAYSPIITSSPQIITYGVPVVTRYRPVVTYPRTVRYRVPVVTYRPAVVRYRVPVTTYRVPVTTYRPVVTSYAPVLVPGGTLIVRPKVYVTGQPIRNILRAMTP
jgi:hypothetical protein